MVIDSSASGSLCQYPKLEIVEYRELTNNEKEYFKNDKNEVKNRSVVEGIIGGVIILFGILLLTVFMLGIHSVILMVFAIIILFMGGAFCFNAITVKGTTEERFAKGEIKAAKLVIPNVNFIRYHMQRSGGELDSGHFYIKRCCTGTYDGQRHIITMYKRNPAGQLIGSFNSISDEIEQEANFYIGKTCLARLTYARGKLFSVDVYLDEVY